LAIADPPVLPMRLSRLELRMAGADLSRIVAALPTNLVPLLKGCIQSVPPELDAVKAVIATGEEFAGVTLTRGFHIRASLATPVTTIPPFGAAMSMMDSAPQQGIPMPWRRFANVDLGEHILGEDTDCLRSLGFTGATVDIDCPACGALLGCVPVELLGDELADLSLSHIIPMLEWHLSRCLHG